MLFVGDKIIYYNNKFLKLDGSDPPDPELHEGYWIHKDTGVKTEFDSTDSSISGTTFNSPTWKNNASEIRLPEGVTAIANNALANSPDLVTLVLPSSTTSIGSNILSNTPKFEKLYSYAATAPSLASLGNNVGDYRLQIKVEADSFDSYRLASGWSQYHLKLFVLNDLIPGSRVHNGYTHSDSSITLSGQSNVIIENRIFDASTVVADPNYGVVSLFNCSNIIIRNCRFINITVSKVISIINSQNVSVYNCDIIDCWWGILGGDNTGSVRIFSNDFKNIKGHLLGSRNCQAVQLSNCSGPDTRIQDNAVENEPGLSGPEDVINVFACFFPIESPYICRSNWIRGGGPSNSSGGMLLGDWGGNAGIIEDNILVNPGQYGISIAGGANQILRNNVVYGEQFDWSNVGLIVVDWTPDVPPNGNYEVSNNRIFWINRDGAPNPFWVWDEQQWPIGWSTNAFQDPTVTPSILPIQIIGV